MPSGFIDWLSGGATKKPKKRTYSSRRKKGDSSNATNLSDHELDNFVEDQRIEGTVRDAIAAFHRAIGELFDEKTQRAQARLDFARSIGENGEPKYAQETAAIERGRGTWLNKAAAFTLRLNELIDEPKGLRKTDLVRQVMKQTVGVSQENVSYQLSKILEAYTEYLWPARMSLDHGMLRWFKKHNRNPNVDAQEQVYNFGDTNKVKLRPDAKKADKTQCEDWRDEGVARGQTSDTIEWLIKRIAAEFERAEEEYKIIVSLKQSYNIQ